MIDLDKLHAAADRRVWVLVRRDGWWQGPFGTEAQAVEFLRWKKEREPGFEAGMKMVTLGQVLERLATVSRETPPEPS